MRESGADRHVDALGGPVFTTLTVAHRADILELLGLLYPNVSAATLAARFEVIVDAEWRCVGVYEEGRLLSLFGYRIATRFYCGAFLYVDHFVVRPELRSAGLGLAMLREAERLAREAQCEQVCLDTFMGNTRAQAFWEREGFEAVGKHYVKPLT